MSPGLSVLPAGAEADQVIAWLVVPKLVKLAVNCCCVPTVTEPDGETVMVGV